MLRQYNPPRFSLVELGGAVRKIGTIPVGSILRLTAGTKVRVEAWIPRDYALFSRGRFRTVRIAGGHLAMVRRLSDGRLFWISDAYLVDAEEA